VEEAHGQGAHHQALPGHVTHATSAAPRQQGHVSTGTSAGTRQAGARQQGQGEEAGKVRGSLRSPCRRYSTDAFLCIPFPSCQSLNRLALGQGAHRPMEYLWAP